MRPLTISSSSRNNGAHLNNDHQQRKTDRGMMGQANFLDLPAPLLKTGKQENGKVIPQAVDFVAGDIVCVVQNSVGGI
jgi:hypothetical protein